MNREWVHSTRLSAPGASGVLLQRQCACGKHKRGGAACTDCRENNETAVRRSQSADSNTISLFERRHRGDFSRVQTHGTGIQPTALQRQTSNAKRDARVPNADDFLKLLLHADQNRFDEYNPFKTRPQRGLIAPPIPSTSPLFKQPQFSMLAPWAPPAINLNLPGVDAQPEPGIGFNRGPFRFFAGKAEENNSPGGSPPQGTPRLPWISEQFGKVLENTEGYEVGVKLFLDKLKRKKRIVTF